MVPLSSPSPMHIRSHCTHSPPPDLLLESTLVNPRTIYILPQSELCSHLDRIIQEHIQRKSEYIDVISREWGTILAKVHGWLRRCRERSITRWKINIAVIFVIPILFLPIIKVEGIAQGIVLERPSLGDTNGAVLIEATDECLPFGPCHDLRPFPYLLPSSGPPTLLLRGLHPLPRNQLIRWRWCCW